MELDAAMDVDENINSNDDMSDYNEQEQNSEEEEEKIEWQNQDFHNFCYWT